MVQNIGLINKNSYTVVIADSDRLDTPLSGYQVSDSALGSYETVRVTLSALPYYTQTDLGSLRDPTGGGTWDPVSHTFTENAQFTITPTPATLILDRLVYTPPVLNPGQGQTVLATVSVNGQTDPNGAVRLETVTPPAITNTVANQPVASGSTIRPFATTYVSDGNFSYNTTLKATITLTDGGRPTDSDGLLSGNGLSKIGVGTYTLAGMYSLYGLGSLVFTPTAALAGTTRTTIFDLNVQDVGASLVTDNQQTSVLVIGPTAGPPLIAGTWATQTVAANGTIKPFSGVTVSDTNAKPLDSVTLTVNGGGILSGQGLSAGIGGTYTIAAGAPDAVTAILNGLVFTPPPLAAGQASNSINIRLDVADGGQVATDTKTLISELAVPPPPPITPSPNYTVVMAGAGGSITDAGGNVWTIDNIGKVAINGSEDVNTGNVIELAYVNGTIWQENRDKLWWGETTPNSAWAPDAGTPISPLAASVSVSTPTPTPTPTPGLTVMDTTTGQPLSVTAQLYTGPVAGLTSEFINATTDNLSVTVTTPGWFIHTGSGNDAIAVSSGNNVLDGSTGSNFLTGGTGNDTFFVDDRGPTSNIWSTVNNFHTGDSATIWGVTPNDFKLNWLGGQGAAGYTGLTLGVTKTGVPDANLTLVGYTSADLTNGRLTISFGTTAASNGVAGSAFMFVHAN